jgi:hypothetical protein
VLGAVSGADGVCDGEQLKMTPEVNESAGQPSAEALSHEAECRCPKCRAFWFELFVTTDERSVMTGEEKVDER